MKLQIDIKPEDQFIPLEQGYIYRWDRIALVAAAALLLLVLVGTLLFKLLAPQEAEQTPEPTAISSSPTQAEEPAPQQTAAASSPYFVNEAPTEAEASADGEPEPSSDTAQAAKEMVASSPPEQSEAPNERSATSTDDAVTTVDTASAEQGTANTAAEAASQSYPGAAANTKTNTTAVTAEAAEPATNNSGLPFSGLNTEIYSSKIKRFVITNGVRDKEPMGTLNDITVNQNEAATIYAYSEALNFKDDTLRYVWSLNGKKVAEVKVPVWSARWRSYSSKFVTAKMRGDWQVELRDQNNELLAASKFQH